MRSPRSWTSWTPARSPSLISSTGFELKSGRRTRRHLRFTESVGVVGAELGEGLVGRTVVVGAGGGGKVQFVAQAEQVLGLLAGVGRVEGLDSVGGQRADQVLDLL